MSKFNPVSLLTNDIIQGMLNHQIEFSKAMTELYKPITGRASDPEAGSVVGNEEGIKACEEYETIVAELQATLAPELETIETRVISPADQLLEVIKLIRKSAVKRDHKRLDYDRHRGTLKKLQEKKDKSLKDEKALFKAENEVEQATQEYNYHNDLLKDELPKLFALEAEFIKPLFQAFYYMQLNVFYTLHEKMQALEIAYFDLQTDVEEGFQKKRGDVQDKTDALTIGNFRTRNIRHGKPHVGDKEKMRTDSLSSQQNQSELSSPPPPYSAATSGTNSPLSPSQGKPVPPPPHKPSELSHPKVETVTALYDYEAQAHGDLSFSAGEVVEITTRTDNQNEWWSGKIGDREGQFPGKIYPFYGIYSIGS